MLLPRSCPICGALGRSPCEHCVSRLPSPAPLPHLAHLSSVQALMAFDGTGRDLVLALKYRNRRDALGWLGASLASKMPAGVDVVTHVPTTASRRHRRGFDQAALLARATSRRCAVQYRPLLIRVDTTHQTGRSALQRRAGPALKARRIVPPVVVLIDDVLTTGASLSAAAKVLRVAGASEVHALVVGYTPPRTKRTATKLKGGCADTDWVM